MRVGARPDEPVGGPIPPRVPASRTGTKARLCCVDPALCPGELPAPPRSARGSRFPSAGNGPPYAPVMLEHGIDRVEALPRLGWVEASSPVESCSELARAMGLDGLWVKRDDTLGLHHGLHGGTKVRKLDLLLAAPPWRDAPRWASIGAIGSGHLVALSTAARLLDRTLHAHLFWEQPLPALLNHVQFGIRSFRRRSAARCGVSPPRRAYSPPSSAFLAALATPCENHESQTGRGLEDLAYVASGPCALRYSDARVGVGLRDLRLLLSTHSSG